MDCQFVRASALAVQRTHFNKVVLAGFGLDENFKSAPGVSAALQSRAFDLSDLRTRTFGCSEGEEFSKYTVRFLARYS